MSKAFTRESDDAPDAPLLARHSALPPGAKNYLTPEGAELLQAELSRLLAERPSLSGRPDDADARRQLAALDHRIAHLQQSLASAIVVPPPAIDAERLQVRFGATVTVRDSAGEEDVYRIVGVDEMDANRGWVSHLSPIAKALLHAKQGGSVRFRFPSGEDQLAIVKVSYE